VHARPDASTDQASRSPRGTADALSINTLGRHGRGDKGARSLPDLGATFGAKSVSSFAALW